MHPSPDTAGEAERAFREARALEDAVDPTAAAAAYRRVLERFPGDVRTCNNLGMLLESAGRTDEAASLFRLALEREPDALPVLMNLGALEHARGRREEAGTLYRRVLVLAPDALPACLNLARLHFDRGEFAEARDLLEPAAARSPGEAAVHAALGTVRFEQGEHGAALESFERALALAPGGAETIFHVARALDALERWDEAISRYRESLAADARSVVVHERLARLLFATGRRGQAEALLREWLAREPGQPVAAHFLASIGAEPAPARAADGYVSMVFDRFADDFDATLRRLHYRAPELVAGGLLAVAGEPRGAADVLDAGCGTGLCGSLVRAWARRLVGVDLSSGMLARARAAGGYDLLVRAELTAFLAARAAAWDVVISADALVYFGELGPVLRAAATAMKPGGRLVFTLERAEGGAGAPWELQVHGRYRHRQDHVEALLRAAGLEPLSLAPVTPRWEGGQPVPGLLVCAGRAGG